MKGSKSSKSEEVFDVQNFKFEDNVQKIKVENIKVEKIKVEEAKVEEPEEVYVKPAGKQSLEDIRE